MLKQETATLKGTSWSENIDEWIIDHGLNDTVGDRANNKSIPWSSEALIGSTFLSIAQIHRFPCIPYRVQKDRPPDERTHQVNESEERQLLVVVPESPNDC